ncbi:MAG: hypothetical protein IKD04_04220 [Clostridia bacterium]|nr:hypothetical protein [Clostridia bacterium]
MLKKFLSIALALCLALCCSACLEDDTPNNDTDITSSQTESDVESTIPVHTHSFSEATCTSPEECSCGATSGSALGHSFTAATCSTPETCEVCGLTEGSALEHKYTNGVCVYCGAKDASYSSETLVWIPTRGGKKYHRNSGCSNMIDPEQVTKTEAINRGFGACGRCY